MKQLAIFESEQIERAERNISTKGSIARRAAESTPQPLRGPASVKSAGTCLGTVTQRSCIRLAPRQQYKKNFCAMATSKPR